MAFSYVHRKDLKYFLFVPPLQVSKTHTFVNTLRVEFWTYFRSLLWTWGKVINQKINI